MKLFDEIRAKMTLEKKNRILPTNKNIENLKTYSSQKYKNDNFLTMQNNFSNYSNGTFARHIANEDYWFPMTETIETKS